MNRALGMLSAILRCVWFVAVVLAGPAGMFFNTLIAVQSAAADVSLPAIISDGMVLQRAMKVPLWGWADLGEKVTVTLEGKQYSAVADNNREWMLRIEPHEAGGPFEIIVAGRNTITLKNVLFGDVWLCGGQSNMGWGVGNSATPEQIARINYPNMRQFGEHVRPNITPQRIVPGGWRIADPKNVGEFCAVGFWFAEKLQQELNVPIGLIQTSHGSSSGETWIPRETLLGDPDFAPMFERDKAADMPRLQAEYDAAMVKWKASAEEARAKGQSKPAKPWEPKEKYAYILRHSPGYCFNGGISPVIPFGLKGVLWYQGESNSGRAYQYRKVLPLLISQWRKLWNQGDFPFLIVQISSYLAIQDEPGDSDWAELREAQVLTAKNVPNCGYGVSLDVGDAKDPHPRNKWDVGKRMALVALATVHGKDIEYSGPVFNSVEFKDGKAILKFDHADGMRAGREGSNEPLRGFSVAGEDRKFHWADAEIVGQTVVLACKDVPKPVAVRYAWASNPVCNLYNKAGLPAGTFRTDEWPGITLNEK